MDLDAVWHNALWYLALARKHAQQSRTLEASCQPPITMEGVYGRIHFPTCWCVNRLPERIVLRLEATYRAELVRGCAEAADDREFYRAIVSGCAYWVLSMCHFTPLAPLLEHDEPWGIATLR